MGFASLPGRLFWTFSAGSCNAAHGGAFAPLSTTDGEIASRLHTRAKLAREESTQVIRRVTGELAGLVFPVR